MTQILSDKRPIARKAYHCDASDFVRDFIEESCKRLSFADMRKIVIARREKWQILKGTKYVYQFGKYEGDIYAFRARIDMHEIALKYNYYPED